MILQTLFIIAVCAAGFSSLLSLSFQRGMIFQNYLVWLAKRLLTDKDLGENELKTLDVICEHNDNPMQCANEYLKDVAMQRKFYYKPLGGCPICFNVWVSVIVFVISAFALDFSLWWLIPFACIEHWCFMATFRS